LSRTLISTVSQKPVFRFAPSPNGYLHLGHAYSALLNAKLAAEAGGRLLLRIEDIDTVRCRPAFVEAALEDLAWLGLTFEEPVRHQSRHFADYAAALDRLDSLGLLYPASASRGEIAAAIAEAVANEGAAWPRDPEGAPLYPRRLLPRAAGKDAALRLDMAAALARVGPLAWHEEERGEVAADPARWGDVVLRRKDVPASYHIAVVVDDAIQGVTHVVRGQDLIEATAIHRLLQDLLGLPAPSYRHHRLIRGGAGEKLSKSLASKSLRALRAEGRSPEEIGEMVGL
jgi:glutamyl-Q tRNA(Asp) synthetase